MKSVKVFFEVRVFFSVYYYNHIFFGDYSRWAKVQADYGYRINRYDVNLKVSGENIFDVTETITVHFFDERHGIYRDIPILNRLKHSLDGKSLSTSIKAAITHISVTDGVSGKKIPFKEGTEGHYLSLTIGDPAKTLTGDKTYVIHYSYALGEDGINSFDELYYDLIGNNWNTSIEKISFKITMPKTFDKSQIQFILGTNENISASEVQYIAAENSITGTVNRMLEAGEGLTIRLKLPNDYFNVLKEDNRIWILLSGLCMLISLLLLILFGRNPKLHLQLEVTSFEDLTPAEAGYVQAGFGHTNHITSLILYWANKDYLSIESSGESDLILIK